MGMRYWQRYDARHKIGNIKNLYYFVLAKARKLGAPFRKKSKRGRNFAISPCEYVAMYIISTLLDLSLRDDELLSDVLCGKHIDHSTFGKANNRISYHYLKKLLIMIWNEIRNLIGEETFSVLIADSTGVKTDRLYSPTLIKCRKKKYKVVDKMNILAEYYPEKNVIAIVNADAFFASDAYSAMRMLKETQIKAETLFGDAGFDCEELVEEYSKLIEEIKPKEYSYQTGLIFRSSITFYLFKLLYSLSEFFGRVDSFRIFPYFSFIKCYPTNTSVCYNHLVFKEE